MISGKKYWPDGTPVPGQQFEYNFDDIGNRSSTKAGGDQNGSNLRSANYTANNLNQYTSRDVPAAADIIGAALATASSVSVNGNSPYRRVEYFRHELSVDNSSAPQWQSVTVSASGQSPNTTGNIYVPKTPEQFTYDADGNLLTDGRWNYTWDAENRLVSMQAISTVPTAAKLKLDFEYDWRGRRIRKDVSTWNTGTSSYQLSTRTKFVYDGWNLVAILNSSSILQSFVWGTDLSGTAQGAGGVGGLLAVSDSTQGTHFAAFDGNGNVAALMKASDGTGSAIYEYSPFGELLRATGPMAKASPPRFSTKFHDDETDLLYYGYRYYNAAVGRWTSGDPLEALQSEEAKFDALLLGQLSPHTAAALTEAAVTGTQYVFARNAPPTLYDLLGLCVPLPDSGPGSLDSHPIKHKIFKGEASTLTFHFCCPTDMYLAFYGLVSSTRPPPPTLNNATFPNAFTGILLSGGDKGNQHCYTLVTRTPTTYGSLEKDFLSTIRVTGACCCRANLPNTAL